MRRAISKLNVSDLVFDAHNYVKSVKDGSVVVEAESRMDVTNSMLGLMGVPSWQRGSSSNIMGSSLSSLVSVMQLGKVAYEFEHSLFAAASCTFCKASFMFMQYYLDRGLSLEKVKEDAKMICHGVSLVSKPVCRGLVDAFAFDVVHVLRYGFELKIYYFNLKFIIFSFIRTSEQSAEEMCGFMFGEGCG